MEAGKGKECWYFSEVLPALWASDNFHLPRNSCASFSILSPVLQTWLCQLCLDTQPNPSDSALSAVFAFLHMRRTAFRVQWPFSVKHLSVACHQTVLEGCDGTHPDKKVQL